MFSNIFKTLFVPRYILKGQHHQHEQNKECGGDSGQIKSDTCTQTDGCRYPDHRCGSEPVNRAERLDDRTRPEKADSGDHLSTDAGGVWLNDAKRWGAKELQNSGLSGDTN